MKVPLCHRPIALRLPFGGVFGHSDWIFATLAADADLLEGDERAKIEAAIVALDAAVTGDRPGAITTRTEALDAATHAWAGRRMDRAGARAIAGKQVSDVEHDVERAAGVDAHVEAHATATRPG